MQPKKTASKTGDDQPLLRFGIVSEVHPNGTARVRLEDEDNVNTMPIPVLHQNTGNRVWYWMPEVGDRVACMLDSRGEQGAIVGGIYSESNLPPVQDLNKFYFKFGAIEIQGDVTTGVIQVSCTKLEIVTTQNTTIQSTTQTTINGKSVMVTGGLDSDGDVMVSSGQ